jgi:hypothetical protein
MGTHPPPPPNAGAPNSGAGGVGRRIEEAIELIEMELRHTIAYVNDAVIPEVRRESISAMRTVAETLRNLADRIDQKSSGANFNGQGPNQPSSPPKDPRA